MKIEKRLNPGLRNAVKNVTTTFRDHYAHNRGARDILLQDLFEELLLFASGQDAYRTTVRDLIEICWMVD